MLLIASVVSGCSGQGNSEGPSAAPANPPDNQPVTLTFYNEVGINDANWENFAAVPVKKKFPNITLEQLPPTKENKLQYANNLVGSGTVPDLLFTGLYFLPNWNSLGVSFPIDDMMKQNNVDIKKFDPVGIDALKVYGDGKLIGLPVYYNPAVLYYNKDIFDKFGVPYPKDGRKLTRTDAGTNYQGLIIGDALIALGQLTMSRIDPKTNQSILGTAPFRENLQLYQDLYSIPGMNAMNRNKSTFLQDRTTAMMVLWANGGIPDLDELNKTGNPLNWDMVTIPYWPEKQKVGSAIDEHLIAVTAQSKHKRQAFEVMKYISSSIENQTSVAQHGYVPALIDHEVRKHYGELTPTLQGKNVNALFAYPNNPRMEYHILQVDVADKYIKQSINAVIQNGVDINTALRQADEATKKDVAAWVAANQK
jgi:multiple sugar transport system substrate-binding protein